MTEQIEQKILEAKAASGASDVLVVETDVEGCEEVAFRVPTAAEWKRYRAESLDPNPAVKANAATPLVVSCCIYPQRKDFERAIEAHPGLIETFSGELVEHAGANRAKKVRKL